MYRHLRTVAAMGLLGATTIGLSQLGCTSRLGPVHAKQATPWFGRPELPDVTVARAADCVAEYGSLLEPGYHTFDSKVLVDEDGDKEDVTIDDIPNSAYDLGACMRNALRAMPIAKEPLRQGVETLKYQREHASEEHHSIARFINVIPGVPIIVSELVFEAEGYTIVLPVAVKVVAKPEKFIDSDKRTMAKVGQLAIDMLGYEEIMTRAEQIGWVKTVRFEQAQSAAEKKFIGDVPPTSSAVVEAAFKRVMTRAAPAALLASQADSPAPGPGDAVAVGILAVGLLAVGAIAAYEIITVEGMPVVTTPVPAPASAAQPTATTAPPSPPKDCPRNERFIPDHTDNATGCYDKKGNVRCYSRRHTPCAGVHTHGMLHYQKIRKGVCVEVVKGAVRCEGPFTVSGPCVSVSTVECGTVGTAISGIFED